MIPSEWLDQATLRIAPSIRRTLLTNDAELNLYLKWENHQVTGSFKARGALNKTLTLEPWETRLGLTTASAGNHAVPAKVEAIRSLQAEVRPVAGGYELAEKTAILYAREQHQVWISPYNDGQVIAGQGTVGLEILQDLPDQDGMTWLVPVGGGGLLAGIGASLERSESRPRLVGVQAESSAFMHALCFRGDQTGVEDLPTLADGLAGEVEADSLTIPMIERYADDILLVSEEEIGSAVAFAWRQYGERIEGSGAVGLAALLAGRVKSPVVAIVSGGNVQPEIHEELCRQYCVK